MRNLRPLVEWLASRQLAAGDFPVYKAMGPDMQREAELDPSCFPTAQIAACLLEVAGAEPILARARAFLRQQREPFGTWRYWTRTHPYHGLIPVDLDDTALASWLLPGQPNRGLLLANRDRHGRFYTWVCPRPVLSWRHWLCALRPWRRPLLHLAFWRLNEARPSDRDAVVNANVLLALGSGPWSAPLVPYFARILEERREERCDRWYLSPVKLHYALARAYRHGVGELEPLRALSLARLLEPARRDALDTALALSALAFWGYRGPAREELAASLWDRQPWPRLPAYFGGPKRASCFGSEELTTAFCLEALHQSNR